MLFSCVQPTSSCVKRSRRYVAKDPERMLDAPNLLDDFCEFYLTRISPCCNVCVMCRFESNRLGQNKHCGSCTRFKSFSVECRNGRSGCNGFFFWIFNNFILQEMRDFDELQAHPTLVKWSCEGQYIAVGFSDGQLKVNFAN